MKTKWMKLWTAVVVLAAACGADGGEPWERTYADRLAEARADADPFAMENLCRATDDMTSDEVGDLLLAMTTESEDESVFDEVMADLGIAPDREMVARAVEIAADGLHDFCE